MIWTGKCQPEKIYLFLAAGGARAALEVTFVGSESSSQSSRFGNQLRVALSFLGFLKVPKGSLGFPYGSLGFP